MSHDNRVYNGSVQSARIHAQQGEGNTLDVVCVRQSLILPAAAALAAGAQSWH